ncbi:peptide-methionine (R)-S-oxide reductase MsrB [Schaalia hyovaginalis]|uniref:peptide-methionine (R)-S-oxide reductase n=1 Tax=Schaalia hyovaginalis TaxID=29316 RepID=A0A7K0K760_9ACTO|nr:peptide-methionine (R)-S-oxide reductase MsrB [Schaalia hyovaginalis]MBB6335633.1 peptide-methionine (R)-S-oxide reductase [Schaalia hyovaginalis]MCI7671752.1 peptide-methionine (R)-S-oxide reductase MsrB [Schaalia hyovaginalis]MDY2668335.1 peptide-methionine (R)-S-oxide reductase MsrB [Schaalia hyovaginalis]MDY4263559.1 peptide-methionine (R)-S-oxide reductase MsrB [Schaalia hyovaginalis]MDY5506601.1 peptide-methionine (R)-S-oxide reductase MsrB [Schaalia hyovaginalis]
MTEFPSLSDASALSDADWRRILTPMQYHVLREAGTERPFTGELLEETREGVYRCAACGAELFDASTKFESHCGWPSFYQAKNASTSEVEDTSHGMVRTEVRCTNCGSHLGHVFPDAPDQPTGMRYCMNSAALVFEPTAE